MMGELRRVLVLMMNVQWRGWYFHESVNKSLDGGAKGGVGKAAGQSTSNFTGATAFGGRKGTRFSKV